MEYEWGFYDLSDFLLYIQTRTNPQASYYSLIRAVQSLERRGLIRVGYYGSKGKTINMSAREISSMRLRRQTIHNIRLAKNMRKNLKSRT